MRLFIAVNFNDDTKNRLNALCNELRYESKDGKFTLPENLHLTLVFLGECNANQAETVKVIMDMTVFEPFRLMIERIGRFKRDRGDIWWAGVGDNECLLNLQRNLSNGLCAKGFALEKRGYNPHITLGREIVTDIAPRQIKPFVETVSSIELMKSERIMGKLTYKAIYTKG